MKQFIHLNKEEKAVVGLARELLNGAHLVPVSTSRKRGVRDTATETLATGNKVKFLNYYSSLSTDKRLKDNRDVAIKYEIIDGVRQNPVNVDPNTIKRIRGASVRWNKFVELFGSAIATNYRKANDKLPKHRWYETDDNEIGIDMRELKKIVDSIIPPSTETNDTVYTLGKTRNNTMSDQLKALRFK